MSERRWCIYSDIRVVFGENCKVVFLLTEFGLHEFVGEICIECGAHGTVGAAAVPPPGNAFVGPSPSPRYGGHSDPDLISGL